MGLIRVPYISQMIPFMETDIFMTRNVEEAKRAIRNFVKTSPTLATLIGDLQITKMLGEGGNALVYAATISKGRKLAIKFLAEDCSNELTKRYQRFTTEFREIMQLADTGLVASIYQMGFIDTEGGKYPYLIMKSYPYTLTQWLKNNPIKTLSDLMPIVQNLMACLKIIHANNIVHRDLKPQNIFVTENDKLVLADFGIAWFDPEHYARLALTSPSERLANYEFSAPEQFQKGNVAHPTMDLYALGQLIQWMVTGETHRGTGRRSLTGKDESFARIEPVVDSLLQQDPNKRPQTIEDLESQIDNSVKSNQDRYYDVWFGLYEFERFLLRNFPGKYGLIQIAEPDKIDTFMRQFAQESKNYQMRWVSDLKDSFIREIRQLDQGVWLIDAHECKIETIWVNKDIAMYRMYIIVQMGPMPSFSLYRHPSDEWEEAAWFLDRYITRGEYDDGYADIDGEIMELHNRAEARVRNKKRDFWFIAPAGSNMVQPENEEVVREIYQAFIYKGAVDPDELEGIEPLHLHPEVRQSL